MKSQMPEQYRKTDGFLATDETCGANGVFFIPRMGKKTGAYFKCVVSSGVGWDHVSISIPAEKRCPTWEEMCHIKSIFFEEEECVIQYHPPKSEYVNCHPYCLHLWKPQGVVLPMPDSILVGVK